MQMTIHPDDVLLFNEVVTAMRRVAAEYGLPLRSIDGLPMPQSGMADRLGQCSHDGHIKIVFRCTVDGQWCGAPLDPDEVWDTAAHELAHLRHFNHGDAFSAFHAELRSALRNKKVDHRDKIIDKLVKLQAARQGEAELGNTEAAESFARIINKMLLENELNPSDLDYARATDKDPIIELRVDRERYNILKKNARCAWEETLARVVARAHLCTFLIRPGSNQIWFVGTHSHATVAEYVYGMLWQGAEKMSHIETNRYWRETGAGKGVNNKATGFRAAWREAFVQRIAERFTEARQQAVTAAPEGQQSQALIRLNGALAKAQAYVNDKFSKRGATQLSRSARHHAEAAARGRAAAEKMVLGARVLTSAATTPKQLR